MITTALVGTVASGIAAVGTYPALAGPETLHAWRYSGAKSLNWPWDVYVVIGRLGHLVDIGACLKRGRVDSVGQTRAPWMDDTNVGQTRVSRTTTRRDSSTASPATDIDGRCFMFRMFHPPSRQRARDPPAGAKE